MKPYNGYVVNAVSNLIAFFNRIGLYQPKEILGMSNVYSDRRLGISIQINTSEDRIGLPYFKLYNSFQYTKAIKVARIQFKKPEYVIHKNSDGKENWILNAKDKHKLIEALDIKPMYSGGMAVWQLLITRYNSEKFDLSPEDTFNCRINNYKQFIKDYTALGYINLIDVLPYDLPIPDYRLL